MDRPPAHGRIERHTTQARPRRCVPAGRPDAGNAKLEMDARALLLHLARLAILLSSPWISIGGSQLRIKLRAQIAALAWQLSPTCYVRLSRLIKDLAEHACLDGARSSRDYVEAGERG